jgi:hypothetical protein
MSPGTGTGDTGTGDTEQSTGTGSTESSGFGFLGSGYAQATLQALAEFAASLVELGALDAVVEP